MRIFGSFHSRDFAFVLKNINMNKYLLEGFRNWLGIDQANSSGMTKERWEHYLKYYEDNPEIWKATIEEGIDLTYDRKERSERTEYDKDIDVLRNTIFTWKFEVDKSSSKLKTTQEINTLQEWLDNKYPTKEDRKKVEEINTYDIWKEILKEKDPQGFARYLKRRESIGISWDVNRTLEGGELDLSEYEGLVQIKIKWSDLKSPLTKIILGEKPNLFKFKCIWVEQPPLLDLSGCPKWTIIDFCGDSWVALIKKLKETDSDPEVIIKDYLSTERRQKQQAQIRVENLPKRN